MTSTKLPAGMKDPPQEEDVDMKWEGDPTARAVLPSDRFLPECEIADWRFHASLPSSVSAQQESAKAKIMLKVQQDAMLPLYVSICESLHWEKDKELMAQLGKENEERLKTINERIEDAEENLGDSEIRETMLEKAQYYCSIGDTPKTIEAYELCYDKTIGPGGRLDILLTLIRLGLFNQDLELTRKSIDRAEEELTKGGDWERKNKLKVYKGVLALISRNFSEAADHFLSSVATFTANELIAFDRFVFFTAVVSLVTLQRPTLREKVLFAPEVLQVAQEDPILKTFLTSFYQGEYKEFMTSLLGIMERVRMDRYLHHHYRFLIRSLRLRAYQQYLEPFKSVAIDEMADTFGISKDMMEKELSSFIATGKLSCKINLVTGVIESNRPDSRNSLYLETIKTGDALLNRIQKLSRVIDM